MKTFQLCGASRRNTKEHTYEQKKACEQPEDSKFKKLSFCPAVWPAGTQVDTSTVQRVSAPTRDIYVERTKDGDRVFAGFGRPSQEYCDCFLDADKLPEDILKVGVICNCGCGCCSRVNVSNAA